MKKCGRGIVQRQRILKGIMAVMLMALILLVGLPSPAQAADELTEIRSLLQSSYVDPVPEDVLKAQTIDQTLTRLGDPYTVYFTPSEFQVFQDSLKNQFSGLGIHMNIVPKGVEVASVIPSSPAEGAGLQPGDIITRVDERPLGGLSANQAAALLQGPAGTSVSLAVLRGSSFLFLNITRQALTQPEVSAELLDGHIGYLQINVFGSDIPQVFGKLAADLQQQGANAWILDLRDDPGGYMDAAVKLAGYFIPGKKVVEIHDRSNFVTQLVAPNQNFQVHGPVVVLTNKNSASAAEVLSAALQDHGAAMLLGSKTFGKGSVQKIVNLSDGGALKMTIAHFYSPQGKTINHVGVTPDLKVNPEYAKEDAALLLAINQDAEAGSMLSQGGLLPSDNKIKIFYGSRIFTVPLDQALTTANWSAWQDLVASLVGKAQFQVSSAVGRTPVSNTNVAKLFPLSYPGYQDRGIVQNPPLDRQFDVSFTEPMLATQITSADIQLIDVASGDKMPLAFQQNGTKIIKVIPRTGLQPGRTYWLIVNPSLLDSSGHSLETGSVVVIHT
ncbi:MAG: S41 family peptidase [Desulfosporosinus sp.]|nr:S41 family peptidase [Desulfosporosinus sp.]